MFLIQYSGCAQQSIQEFYSEDIPLPEHPRPDFERDLWINLNGEWEFAADSLDVGEIQYWETADSLYVDRIQVPFSWASPLSGIGKKDFHVGWYARDILIPKKGVWKDKRMYLVIGACDFTTTLWVNGQLVGEHEGGYTPFEFDITDFIAPRGLNRLVIRAEDMPVPDRLVGKQVYGEAKGIWQTVYLEGRSGQHIKYVHFSPDIDNSKVSVKVRLAKPSEEPLIFSIAFADNIVETVAETFPAGQDSLVFDIGTAGTGYTGEWQYQNGVLPAGAGFIPLTVLDNTAVFFNADVNSVHWIPPHAAPPNGWEINLVNGVTGWWVRMEILTIPAALTVPIQQTREVYAITWPRVTMSFTRRLIASLPIRPGRTRFGSWSLQAGIRGSRALSTSLRS